MQNYNEIAPKYILQDLKRSYIRIAANEKWYKQKWMGVPIWQLPDDLLRLQEIIYEVKPQLIVETGTKFGGSAIFFASIMKMIGINEPRVITIDNVKYREFDEITRSNPYASYISASLIGDAASDDIFHSVKKEIGNNIDKILVFLDDNHNLEHVYKEMVLYSELIPIGSYLIVADTVFEDLADTPVGAPTDKYPDVKSSNPRAAIDRFLSQRNDFVRDFRFMDKGVSNFSDGFLKKIG